MPIDRLKMLEDMAHIQQLFLEGQHTSKNILELLLGMFLEVSGSAYGFIGYMRTTQEGKPFLQTEAISGIEGMPQHIYEAAAKNGFQFHNMDTLFGACLLTKQPVIANNPSNDSRAKGVPSGHIPLHRFMGIPLIHQNDMMGMVGLANAPADYTDELHQAILPLTHTCAILMKAILGREETNALLRQARILDEERGGLQEELQNTLGVLMASTLELENQRQQLLLSQELSGMASFDFDLKSKALSCSPNFFKLLGLPLDLTSIELRKRLDAMLVEKKDGGLFSKEMIGQSRLCHFLLADGHMKAFHIRTTPYYDANGVFAHIIGIAIDVTNKEAEEQKAKIYTQSLLELSRSEHLHQGRFFEFVKEVLQEAHRIIGVSIAGFWEFEQAHTVLACRLRYNEAGEETVDGAELRTVDYPRYFKALSNTRVLAVEHALIDHRTNEFNDIYLKPYGITSLIDAQIRYRGQLRGIICIEHIGEPRAWDAGVQAYLGSLTELMALGYASLEQLDTQLELRESERKYRYLFNNNPMPMWIYEVETLQFIDVNQAACDAYGYKRQEFLSMTIADIRPSEDVPKLRRHLANTKDVDYGHMGEWKHITKSKEILDVEIYSHSLQFDGRHTRLVLARDVTERNRTQRRLLQSYQETQNFRNALNNSALISITNIMGEILEVNKPFCDASEYTANELVGKNHRIVNSAVHPPEFFADLWRTISSGKHWRGEICNISKSGRLYWIDATINPVLDEYGRPYQYMAVSYIITERKTAEAEREALINRLTEYAFLTSHDLRGPLARILGLIQLFDMGVRDEEFIATMLKSLKSSAEELDEVIHQMNERIAEN